MALRCPLRPPRLVGSEASQDRTLIWVLPTQALASLFAVFLWTEAGLVPAAWYPLDDQQYVIRVNYTPAQSSAVIFCCYLLAEHYARVLHLNRCLEVAFHE